MRTIEKRLEALEQANQPSGLATVYVRDGETERAAIGRYIDEHDLPSWHSVIIVPISATDAML